MAFDSSIKSKIESSSVLKAEHINEPIDEINKFINKGIGRLELKSKSSYVNETFEPYEYDGWVNSDLIFKPEFYGSPAPRMMAVSGQTHYRERSNNWAEGCIFNPDATGLDFVGVPGSCATIKLRHSAVVNVMASFYMFEFGGINFAPKNSVSSPARWYPIRGDRVGLTTAEMTSPPHDRTNNTSGYESRISGTIRLMLDGVPINSSTRLIFTSTVEPQRVSHIGVAGNARQHILTQRGFVTFAMIGRHQHSITLQARLSEGTHDIGLGFRAQPPNNYEIKSHLAAVRSAAEDTEGEFFDHYAVERKTVPTLTDKKNVFFCARNLVVDAYYTDNVPI